MGTIRFDTGYWIVAAWMSFLGSGLGMMMQNRVVAEQNEVAVRDLGAASSFVAFTRSMGGAIGVSALGALLGQRVKDHLVTAFTDAGIKPSAMSGGGGAIPNIHEIPQPVRTLVQDSYGQAIAEVFLSAAPFALLAFLITLFIRETVLRQSTSNIAAEQAAEPLHEQVWNTPDDHVEHEHGPRIREF